MRGIRLWLSVIVLATQLVTAVRPSLASGSSSTGEPERSCPGHPVAGKGTDWALIAFNMTVGPVPSALGGGVAHPTIEIEDGGCTVVVTIPGTGMGSIYFDYQGGTWADAEKWMTDEYTSKLPGETVNYGKGGTVNPVDDAITMLLQMGNWFSNGSGLQMEPELGRPPVAFYAGHLPHEARIFWVLAVMSPGAMRSIHGFFIADAPPHLQQHFWVHGASSGELAEVETGIAKERIVAFINLLRKGLGLPPVSPYPD